ncbi:hypothetical protein [Chromobacterium haemolyticum]|uniref:hypothetical protein n=1 Tax=Chromobacterium haemolyticum TaxID=394935 RepID=UPI0011307B3C|nr:hypothetical protein [Chromobacterium haemolyticum]
MKHQTKNQNSFNIPIENKIHYNCGRSNNFLFAVTNHLQNITPNKGHDEALRSSLSISLYDAYRANCIDCLHALHLTLNKMLLHFYSDNEGYTEQPSLILEIQNHIAQAQLEADLKLIANEALPTSLESLISWLKKQENAIKHNPHPLFIFLEKEATIDEFQKITQIDHILHTHFDNILKFSQNNTPNSTEPNLIIKFKSEKNEAYANLPPPLLFESNAIKKNATSTNHNTLPWEALAYSNCTMHLSYFIKFYTHRIGYFRLSKLATLINSGLIKRGGVRLGIESEPPGHYNNQNKFNSGEWVNSMSQFIKKDSEEKKCKNIATGLLLNKLVTSRYWNSILSKTKNQHIQITS